MKLYSFRIYSYVKKDFRTEFCFARKVADEKSLLRSDDGRPEFFSYEGEIQMKCLQPASGGDGGNS